MHLDRPPTDPQSQSHRRGKRPFLSLLRLPKIIKKIKKRELSGTELATLCPQSLRSPMDPLLPWARSALEPRRSQEEGGRFLPMAGLVAQPRVENGGRKTGGARRGLLPLGTRPPLAFFHSFPGKKARRPPWRTFFRWRRGLSRHTHPVTPPRWSDNSAFSPTPLPPLRPKGQEGDIPFLIKTSLGCAPFGGGPHG